MVLAPVDFAGVAEEIEPSLRPPRDVDGFLRGLDEMIGLEEVKRTVGGLVAEARLAAERATRGLPTGNPSLEPDLPRPAGDREGHRRRADRWHLRGPEPPRHRAPPGVRGARLRRRGHRRQGRGPRRPGDRRRPPHRGPPTCSTACRGRSTSSRASWPSGATSSWSSVRPCRTRWRGSCSPTPASARSSGRSWSSASRPTASSSSCSPGWPSATCTARRGAPRRAAGQVRRHAQLPRVAFADTGTPGVRTHRCASGVAARGFAGQRRRCRAAERTGPAHVRGWAGSPGASSEQATTVTRPDPRVDPQTDQIPGGVAADGPLWSCGTAGDA